MRKILSGMLGLIMTTAVVGGVAYAAFSTTATVEGISISAGNAALEIFDSGHVSKAADWVTGLNLQNVYPGFQQSTTFSLKNNSTSAISLAITGQLTAAANWPNLNEAVEVAVNDSTNTTGTGWITLKQWNAAPVTFPGAAIAPNTETTYNVFVRVPTVYSAGTALAGQPVGNEINGLSLNNIVFTLTGTQQ